MEFILKFKEFLEALKPSPSKVTVKNYVADVKHFVFWYETRFKTIFYPQNITAQMISEFQKDKSSSLSVPSIERHISSLRKFFEAMKLQGYIAHSPFETLIQDQKAKNTDPFHLKEFKDFLYVYNASHLTIKNYLIDIKQFLTWAETVTQVKEAWNVADKDLFGKIDSALVAEYKERLLAEHVLSPVSINRKLSSLRKYLSWASANGYIQQLAIPDNLNDALTIPSTREKILPENNIKEVQTASNNSTYSPFPPFRLAQKISTGINFLFEASVIAPIASLTLSSHKLIWKLKGKPLFVGTKRISNFQFPISNQKPKSNFQFSNIKKEFYNPLAISTKHFPWYKKVWHHARYTRPSWYRRYHTYALAHYFNWAILIVFMTAIGFGMYNSFVTKPQNQNPALASAQPLRVLSFQGRLTDTSDNAITSTTHLRFIIYNSLTASGSARLWEEVDTITPDKNGVFSVLLGSNGTGGNAGTCNLGQVATGSCGIPQSLFANNNALYLGVSVEATPELTPRQQLATVAYATNAETLQGLPPITQSGAGTTNVVLALDSTGNLTIGASTQFQSTSGQFSLLGNSLLLGTNAGSNGNVAIAPDGSGLIDLQKPLVNTTLNNNLVGAPGAVEVDDMFAVLATSAASALTINQDGTGPIISASSSGTAKFIVGNTGSIQSSAYGINGGVLYTDGTGLFLQTAAGNLGECLTSNGGGAPSWQSCGGGSNFWNITNGALYPNNSTLDVFLGGTSSASANFAFINNNPGSGTPTASIAGNLTFNSAGIIQTTKNQTLTIGGNSTGNIVLSPLNGAGTVQINGGVTISGLGTGIIHSTGGVLSSSAVSLSSADVTGILPLANGGTNNNLTADNGGIVYSDASKLQILAHSSTVGQCLQSGGSGAPTWGNCTVGGGSNWWNMNLGTLFPVNTTLDLVLGGNSTTSAKFAFINVSSGTPTASISGNITLNSAGVIQTTSNQPLTLGGNSTGNIILSPNNGTGKVTVNGTINSNLTPSITDTYDLGSSALEWNNLYVKNLVTTGSIAGFWQRNLGVLSPTNITDDLAVGGIATASSKFQIFANTGNATSAGSLTFSNPGSIQTTSNQPLTLGGTTTGNIILSPNNGSGTVTINGKIGSSLIPSLSNTYDLGSLTNQWNNIYGKNLYSNGTLLSQLWQENLGVVSPLNISDDLEIGGTATSSGTFQIFANTGNATSAGNLTFSNPGSIQTTSNQPLTLGGTTTGAIILSPNNGTGTVTINGLGTGVVQSTSGVLSTALVNLTSQVTGILPIANGGTNTNSLGSAGRVVYSDGTKYNFTTVGSTGDCLLSNGSGAPDWGSCSTAASANDWILDGGNGILYPKINSLDVLFGGSSTSSANFAFINNAVGTPTASISGNLTLNSAGVIQTTSNQPLTLGGNSTGNIILSPNNGTGTVSINANNIQTASSSINLFTTNATTLSFGVTGGTTTVNSALTLTGNFTPNGQLAASLIPTTTSINLGSASNYYGSAYITNLFPSSTSSYQGFFQRFSGVLSPYNITDDLAVGGVSTSAATFQIFANTGNATTSGNLTFNGNGLIQTTNNLPLTLGGNSTGNIVLSPNNGTGNITINGFFNSSLLPATTNTYDLGSSALSWRTVYANSVVINGQNISQDWQRILGVLSPLNITDDLAIGGNSTNSAKFQVFGLTGNATSSGNFTFSNPGSIQTTSNQPLTLGGNSTGNIILSPNNGSGTVTVNGTTVNVAGTNPTLTTSSNNNLSVLAGSGTITLGTVGGGNLQFFSGSNTLTNAGNLTLAGTITLPNSNTITGISNALQLSNGLTLNSAGLAGTHTNIDTSGNILPGSDGSANLGAANTAWNNVYAKNLYLPSAGGTGGYWQLNLGALSPTNITNDLLIGGVSTGSATFQIFAASGNATSAGNLTFTNPGSIQTTSNQPLTLGGTTTGNIILSPNNGTGNITINGSFNSSLIPTTTNTYDLGSLSKQWNNIYAHNIFQDGQAITQLWQLNAGVLSPLNISNDVAVGGTATSGAKFQIFGLTGNATSAGNLTFSSPGSIQTTSNQPLTLGGATTGNIILSPNNGTGIVTVNGNSLTSSGSTFNLFTTTASTLGLGVTGGTTTVNSALTVTGNITPNGQFAASLIPTTTSINLGSATNYYGNAYITNLFPSSSSQYLGFWQRNAGTLSPINITDDLLLGGVATNSARFAVINVTAGTPTATLSAQTTGGPALSVGADGTLQTYDMAPLILGSTTTGAISIGTDATARSISIGNNTGATGVTVTAGTGKINLNASTIDDSQSPVTLFSTPTNISVGTSNTATTLALGSGTGTNTITVGNNQTGGSIALGNALTTGTITLGGSSTTGTITIGQYTGGSTSTLNIGHATVGNGGNQSINIGDAASGTGIDTITIGNTNGASVLSLKAGTGGLSLVGAPVNINTTGSGNTSIGNGSGTVSLTLGSDAQGDMFYRNGSGNLARIAAGTAGQCLVGGLTPGWGSCASGTSGSWWTLGNAGTLYPINATVDVILGSDTGATGSAKFAVLNLATGTPTASVSSGLSGTAMSFDANGNIQTARNMALTIGGNTTGNITLAPLNSGTGSTINLNAKTIDDNQSTVTLFGTPTTVTEYGNATTLTVGKAGAGTTTFQNNTLDDNQASVTLFGTPTSLTLGGAATTFNLGKSGGTSTILGDFAVNGNTTLGTNTSNTILLNGLVNGSGPTNNAVQPVGNGATDLGSATHYWGTVYANNFIAPVGGGTSGFWTLSSNVLSPVNSWNDLAVGGNATSSATPWQVFATTVGVNTAGTATSSGGLSFRGSTTNVNLLNGSTLNIKTSVGGDGGLGTVLTLANSGDITQTGNYTMSGNLAVNGGSITTTASSGNIFRGVTNLNIGDTNGTNITIGKNINTGTTTIGGALAVNFNFSIGGQVASNLVPDSTSRNLGSNSNYWQSIYAQDIFPVASSHYMGFWQLNNKIISPVDAGNYDLTIGGTATGSAFQVFANSVAGSPAGTASTSGYLTFTNSAPVIQTTNMYPLAIGSATTGTIQLSPKGSTGLFVNGSGNVGIATTNPTAVLDVAGAASVSSTLTFRSGSATIQAASNNILTLGGNTTGGISFGSNVNSSIIPTSKDSFNLGSVSNEWDTLYVRQIVTASTGGIAGYWQLTNTGVLAPTNLANDVTVGSIDGTIATKSALFQVFGSNNGSIKGGTASTAASLTFSGNNVSNAAKVNLLNNTTLGFYSSVGGDSGLNPNPTLYLAANGNIGLNTSNPLTTLDIAGSASASGNLSWRGLATAHTENILDGGSLGFYVSPGGNAGLASASFPTLYIAGTGNGATSGLVGTVGIGTNAPLARTGLDIEKDAAGNAAFVVNQLNSVGDILTASASGATQFKLSNTGVVTASSFYDLQDVRYFLDPAATSISFTTAGKAGIGTTSPTHMLDVVGDAQIGNDSNAWGENGWNYRRQITIGNTSGSGLINYQVKLTIDTASLISAGKMQADCGDLRFTDSDGLTELNQYWVESGCNTNATTVWLKVPSIPGPTKLVYMYYGSSGKTTQSSTSNTFVRTITNVQAAWRLDEPTYNPINDFSGNGNFATASGTTIVAGKFNNARSFGGASPDSVDASGSGSINFTNLMSIDFWAKPGSTNHTNQDIISMLNTATDGGFAFEQDGTANDNHYFFQWSTGAAFTCNSTAGGANQWTTSINLTANVWNHVVITKSGTSAIAYVNGAQVATCTGTSATIGAPHQDMFFGKYVGNSRYWSGSLDEVHLYNKTLSSSEVTDLYNNYGYVTQASPNNEYVRAFVSPEPNITSYGQEQTSASQVLPSFYVQQSTGNVALGTNSVSSTSALLTVAGDIKSGAYDPTTWGSSYTGYSYRARITIDNTKSASTSANANYQVEVTTNTAAPIALGKMRSDCNDVRFTDADGSTNLNYWMESGCNSTSTIFWVKVPQLPPGEKKNIYMYYGNSSASSSQSSTSNTFFDDFTTVTASYNLDETSASSANDSSGNSQIATTHGTTVTAGRINNARSFNGSTDFLSLTPTSHTDIAASGNYSAFAWIKTGTDGKQIFTLQNGTPLIYMEVGASTAGGTAHKLVVYLRDNGSVSDIPINGTTTIDDNKWHFVGFTVSSGVSNRTVTLYVDGKSDATSTWGTIAADTTSGGTFDIGGNGSTFQFNGIIDNLQMFSTALNITQINELYNYNGYTTANDTGHVLVKQYSYPDPTTTVDTEQDASQVDPTLYVNNTFNSVGIGTANPTATLDVEGNSTSIATVVNQTGSGDILNVEANGTSAMYVTNSGVVGIGTTTPQGWGTTYGSPVLQIAGDFTFGSQGSTSNGFTKYTPEIIAHVTDSGGNTTFSFVGQRFNVDYYWADNPSGNFQNEMHLVHSSGNLAIHGTLSQSQSSPDIAEGIYPSDSSINAGDIVSPDTTQKEHAVKSSSAYDPTVIGAISTDPGIFMHANLDASLSTASADVRPLVLAGRVPLKVTTLNGTIKSGDHITSSTLAGFGEEATKAGATVAIAMEDFTPTDTLCTSVNAVTDIQWTPDDPYNNNKQCFKLPNGTYVGKIMAFINPSWYDPDVMLTSTGDLNITPTNLADTPFALSDGNGNPITRVGAFLSLVVANLRIGSLNAQTIATNSLAIATDNMSIAGQSLHDYIAGIVSSMISNQTPSVNSPIAEVNEVHTNLISPLASSSAIALSLENDSRIEVKNTFSQQTVASIDNNGNATFSGKLNSQNLAVNNDATISGTLYANNIKANSIEGLDAVVGTLSAQNITNVTNMYFATPSGENSTSQNPTGFNGNSSTNSGLLTGILEQPQMGYANIASYSGFLAYVPSLSADTGMFNQGLVSLGSTSLSDTTITGQLAIDSQLILAQNSVNVLGANFDIQPLRQGGVTFEGGLIAINTNGDLTVGGKALFNGGVYANIISPLSNTNDVTIQLGQNSSATGSALATSSLSIKNASGSGVFAINQLGDFVASGEATIGKLNINLVQPALAVSDTEVIATGSAGTAFIKANQAEVTIDNKHVTAKSLIYITPVGNSGVIPYLLRQVPGVSFTVGIPASLPTDTTFNWLIVN